MRLRDYTVDMRDWREFWRRRRAANFLLAPAAALFAVAAAGRRGLYRLGVLPVGECGAPVVVVGNLTAGGGGKTPVVIALALELQKCGMNPGVVSRGYGGDLQGERLLFDDDDWRKTGDEPVLIRRKTGALVCVGKNRLAAARMLAAAGCDVVLSDDGLQHYRLARRLEICVMHSDYMLGNEMLLPAGPLRESKLRLRSCDVVAVLQMGGECGDGVSPPQPPPSKMGGGLSAVSSKMEGGYAFSLKQINPPPIFDGGGGGGVFPVKYVPEYFYNLQNPEETLSAAHFAGKKTVALAGTAQPSRFFATLAQAGVVVCETVPLPDHGRASDSRLREMRADAIVMTEKDAVKYPRADSRLYALAMRAVLPPQITEAAVAAITGGEK